MAFNFPDAPAVGDTHTEAGVEYVYEGNGVWNLAGGGDMQDYVLKAGDQMTVGPLETFQPAHFRANATDAIHGAVRLSGGAAGRTGMVEFIKDKVAAGDPDLRLARFGWGTPTEIEFAFENGCNGLRMIGGGIHIGSDSAVASNTDMSKGICLYGYGGTSQFGFNITSGTLNYTVQSASNKHAFWVGTVNALQVNSLGCKTGVSTAGMGYYIGDNWHGMYFDGSNTMVFTEYHNRFEWRTQTTGTPGADTGTLEMSLYGGVLSNLTKIKMPEGTTVEFNTTGCFLTSSNNNRISYHVDDQHMFFVGGTNMFNIDGVAVRSLVPIEADGFIDRATGLDLIAEIKALRAEIETLKRRK